MREIKDTLTFDDVLLVPRYSDVMPSQVNTATRLTEKIRLNIPMISAAMDTVSESGTAISMARAGGLGVIHRNLSPEEQAAQCRRVKKSESKIIYDPVTIDKDEPLKIANELMAMNGISGLPVVDAQGMLQGIVTRRDLRANRNLNGTVKDVMSTDVVTASVDNSLENDHDLMRKKRVEKLPLVNAQGKLVGLVTAKDLEKEDLFPRAVKDDAGRLLVAGAVGVGNEGFERAQLLAEAGVDALAVDTAHGHSKAVLDTVRRLVQAFHVDVLAGNVATREGVHALVEAGAAAVKIGVGPGSICTTRIVSGVGVPQLTAIMEASEEAMSLKTSIIADGGIKFSGDIVKAIAAGANAVMLGGLLAGTDEAPGEVTYFHGRAFKTYRGMGSIGAMRDGSSDRYFQQDNAPEKLVPEGVEGRVPYKGALSAVLYQLIGGLRSGMGYVGAHNLQELQDRARFVRISGSGLRESHVHDISVTEEPPNYRLD